MLNTRLNDSCGSCPRCPGMLGAEWGKASWGGVPEHHLWCRGETWGALRLGKVGRGGSLLRSV